MGGAIFNVEAIFNMAYYLRALVKIVVKYSGLYLKHLTAA